MQIIHCNTYDFNLRVTMQYKLTLICQDVLYSCFNQHNAVQFNEFEYHLAKWYSNSLNCIMLVETTNLTQVELRRLQT